MFGFEGRRVVVTGAGGGLGTALVGLFAELGAAVVACDHPRMSLAGLPVAETRAFDLADREATLAAASAIRAGGAPDVVIANAGATRAETLAAMDPETFDRELDVNLRGTVHFTAALLPAMRRRPRGAAFVFISSVNAGQHFGNPAYSAAKAGLEAWMRAIATEEGPNGIRANAVRPGSIRTPAWDARLERDPEIVRRVAALYPLGRLVEPREVATAVAFLASDLARGITGVVLPVDAGLGAANLPFLRAIS